jgi:hypothetical protein
MNENIETIISEFESGKVSRRHVVSSLTAMLATVAGGAGALQAHQNKSSKQKDQSKSLLTPEDLKPFEEIARRKGVPFRVQGFDAQSADKSALDASGANQSNFDRNKIHLDMDMVEESIRCAIKTSTRAGQTLVQPKLEWLLKKGTDAQKVEFVLGSGTYYFPEDIEHLAKLSRLSGGMPLAVDCEKVCETVWTIICLCRDLGTSTIQECRDEAREVCHIRCPKE